MSARNSQRNKAIRCTQRDENRRKQEKKKLSLRVNKAENQFFYSSAIEQYFLREANLEPDEPSDPD